MKYIGKLKIKKHAKQNENVNFLTKISTGLYFWINVYLLNNPTE